MRACYKAIGKHQARAVIARKSKAVISGNKALANRDESLRLIKELGEEEWKKQSEYHCRCVVE